MANYEDLFRLGTVVSVHPELHRVRVRFRDKDDMVSDEIPVLVPGSLKNKAHYITLYFFTGGQVLVKPIF